MLHGNCDNCTFKTKNQTWEHGRCWLLAHGKCCYHMWARINSLADWPQCFHPLSEVKASAARACCLIKHRNLWNSETCVLNKYLTSYPPPPHTQTHALCLTLRVFVCVYVCEQRARHISCLNSQLCRRGRRSVKGWRMTATASQVGGVLCPTCDLHWSVFTHISHIEKLFH